MPSPLLRRIWSRMRRSDALSEGWLLNQARREQRIEFHSAPMQWPVRKLWNESSVWNKAKMRRVS